MSHIRLFVSAVTLEFRSYRDELRRQLERPNVTVQIQENFIATGSETLEKLDLYIRGCDGVVHLVGDMTGAWAEPPTLTALTSRYSDLADRLPCLRSSLARNQPPLSYTQWEAYLAVYHGRVLVIAMPATGALRDPTFQGDAMGQQSQRAHLERLRSLGRYPEITFANRDQLASAILRSTLLDLLAKAGVSRLKPIALPYPSLGTLFKGREAFMSELRSSLARETEGRATAVVGKALHGLGGIGKTRLAVEYAWQHHDDYSALLFVLADTPEDLWRNLAALVGPLLLDLPEQAAKDEEARVAAALRWLQQNPGWFLIIDNVDTPAAAAEVENLLSRLHGGQVLITSRLANWSGLVERLELDVLPPAAAEAFLLERTATRRRKAADDAAEVRALVQELGQLALALEQAGAYIDKHRLTFAQYRAAWHTSHAQVSAWFDPRLMHYPKSIAATWQTSFDQLGGPARQLLDQLSWLSSEPIPETLLDVAVPGASDRFGDPRAALAELETYSLVTRASDAPTFVLHPLVQDVTRRNVEGKSARPLQALGRILRAFAAEQPRLPARSLVLALAWIDAAFTGHPRDVQNWPTLDPLATHAQALTAYADAAGITQPTASLMSRLGLLLRSKARFSEAEPLFRRALAIREATLPEDHPDIAASLSHLGVLCRSQGRLDEAEPLFERALAIRRKSLPAEHPELATSLLHLDSLYRALDRPKQVDQFFEKRRLVRIFMLSNEDANVDYARIDHLIGNMNERFTGVGFQTLRWDHGFFRSQTSFQIQIPEAKDSDIVLAVFRAGIGPELPVDFPRMPDGAPYASGAAYELLTAVEAAGRSGQPDIFVFRCREPPSVRVDDPEASEKRRQWQRLEAFFTHFLVASNFQLYRSPDDLEALVERKLRQWVHQNIPTVVEAMD